MFQMMGVFAEFERATIEERVRAGLRRAKDEGKRLGRTRIAAELEKHIQTALNERKRTGEDGHHAGGNGEAERLGRREIYDKFKFVRLQYWKFSGLGAPEDVAGVDTDLTKHVSEIGSVAHQPAGFHMFTKGISRGNPVARRQDGKLHVAGTKKRIGGNEESIGAIALKCGEDVVDLVDRRCVDDLGLQPHGGSGRVQELALSKHHISPL